MLLVLKLELSFNLHL